MILNTIQRFLLFTLPAIMKISSLAASMLTLAAIQCLPATAQEKVLNLYSARHYQTDEALYANFTRQTGSRSIGSRPRKMS
jgi:spermidine/putrescine-binding protein